MSDSWSPDELIERSLNLIKQQQEIYGEIPPNKQEDPSTTMKNTSGSAQKTTPADEEKPAAAAGGEAESLENLLAACKTLDELRRFCETSPELKTDLQGTNLVFGTGNPQADLMIVGEAPGVNEDKQGEPFVGRAGQLLDKIMEAIGLARKDIYIANILKHRPPDNRDPKPEERQRSLPYLLRQIEIINPKLILCVGRISAATLLGKDIALKDMRQKFHPFHGRELMATYHPAALLRNPNWKRPTWEDVQLLRKRYDELGGKP